MGRLRRRQGPCAVGPPRVADDAASHALSGAGIQDEPAHAASLDDGTSPYKGTFKPRAAGYGAWFAAVVRKTPGQLDV